MRRLRRVAAILLVSLLATPIAAHSNLPDQIDRVEPAIVAIGSYNPLAQPAARFRGTGFAVGDGRLILTNYHVLPEDLEAQKGTRLAVFVGRGDQAQPRRAERAAVDPDHDLALLRIKGDPLSALELGRSRSVRPGERFAFTGFPIGMVLGMYPVTHEGIVSAVTPIAIPRGQARSLDSHIIKRLENPYPVFQLDATAYPGNSGSPVYRQENGRVVGILNMVFVKESKESVLKEPSGIAYAIPIQYARRLLNRIR